MMMTMGSAGEWDDESEDSNMETKAKEMERETEMEKSRVE